MSRETNYINVVWFSFLLIILILLIKYNTYFTKELWLNTSEGLRDLLQICMGLLGLLITIWQLRHSIDQYQKTIEKQSEDLRFSELLNLKIAYNNIMMKLWETRNSSDAISISNMISGNGSYSLNLEKKRISQLGQSLADKLWEKRDK